MSDAVKVMGLTKKDMDKYFAKGKRIGKSKLDHYKMLREINALVETDFAADMEMHLLPHHGTRKYSTIKQGDARKMAQLIGQVYMIAHCIHCGACQKKYIKPKEARK